MEVVGGSSRTYGTVTPTAAGCAGLCRETGGRLLDVPRTGHQRLPLSDGLAWLEQAMGEIVQGGQYLVSGAPGSRKSGLVTQLALDLGLRGVRTLSLLTEESPQRLLDRALRMSGDWPREDAERALSSMLCDDSITIERLPAFLYQHVLAATGRYHGTKVIVLDSVQGHGLPAAATEKYGRLYEFCRLAKSAGITVFLVAHMTKRNQVAGPRDLEHNVDAVGILRTAMDLRLLFVTKNRYGPEQLKGVPLVIDPVTTALRPSPHVEPVAGVARTFLSGGFGVGEMQAMVALPSHGAKPQIQAPGLPRKRVEQILTCIAQVPGLEMDDLDLSIGCLMPGDAYFRPVFGLPLALALIASYLRRPVPPNQLALGEIDLTRTIRPLSEFLVTDVANMLASGELEPPLRVLLPPCAVSQLPSGPAVELVPVARLDDAIRATWPDIELQ
jgi:DNA repair protein RadA/Sms